MVGSAEKNKKFTVDFIITGEPDFPPAGKKWVEIANNRDNPPDYKNVPRIYAGENISVIENFVGMSAQNISRIQQQEAGVINLDPTSFVFTNLAYKDGKITELHYSNGYALNSSKAWSFAEEKAKELGLTFANQIAGE